MPIRGTVMYGRLIGTPGASIHDSAGGTYDVGHHFPDRLAGLPD